MHSMYTFSCCAGPVWGLLLGRVKWRLHLAHSGTWTGEQTVLCSPASHIQWAELCAKEVQRQRKMDAYRCHPVRLQRGCHVCCGYCGCNCGSYKGRHSDAGREPYKSGGSGTGGIRTAYMYVYTSIDNVPRNKVCYLLMMLMSVIGVNYIINTS